MDVKRIASLPQDKAEFTAALGVNCNIVLKSCKAVIMLINLDEISEMKNINKLLILWKT